jgi:hypothetical protein
MFHKGEFHPDAALDSFNSVRIAEGLEPYQAPSGRSQLVSAAVLVLLVTVLVLIFP